MTMEEKSYTLCFVRRVDPATGSKEVLLGMKKRGFGEGKWNGFGGKIEAGESVEDAAIRELREESSVVVQRSDLHKRGYLVFEMQQSQKLMKVHVFEASTFDGEPEESDEMRPQWYNEAAIPYDLTWADDKFWMPFLLASKQFVGHFVYGDDETILTHEVSEVVEQK
jgi:8-oxo-dGTP pyrophosphatase MutT (NUDIX family)